LTARTPIQASLLLQPLKICVESVEKYNNGWVHRVLEGVRREGTTSAVGRDGLEKRYQRCESGFAEDSSHEFVVGRGKIEDGAFKGFCQTAIAACIRDIKTQLLIIESRISFHFCRLLQSCSSLCDFN